MNINMKKCMLLFIISIMIITILPQVFASDIDSNPDELNINLNDESIESNQINNEKLSENENYDYETSVNPSSIDYIKDDSKIVSVSASHGSIGRLEENITNWKVYINNDVSGIIIDEIDSTVDNFNFDLKTISDKLNNGENTIVFHPNQGALEYWCSYNTFKYNPLTVNVIPKSNINYESSVLPSSINYTKGEISIVDVNVDYNSSYASDLEGYVMYAYINGENDKVIINDITADIKSFNFDLSTISDKLVDGINTVTFHPIPSYLEKIFAENYIYHPLTVNVSSTKNSNYYETNVNPSIINYVKNESVIVNVSANFNSNVLNEGIANWKVFINNDTTGIELTIDANVDTFNFDLKSISDKLIEGKNTIIFHPPQDSLETQCDYNIFNYNPLIVNIENPIYVSINGNDTNDGSKENPVASIVKAINIAKTTGIPTIYILEGTYNENSISIDVSLTIRGIGNVIIDAEYIDRIFKIDGPYDVKLSNLTLINGNAPTDSITEDIHEVVNYAAGGAIHILNDAYVELENMIFINNTADEFGGAINSESPYCIVTNCTFINNKAGVFGGAIDFEDKNCSVDNCIFISNDATNGGAIGWIGDNAIITNSYFENNTADTGGAIFVENTIYSTGNLIQNNTFINNYADQQGGAIEVENEQMVSAAEYTQIRNCKFINNSAYNGGAISGYYGDVASLDNIFINNTAGYGGAIATISAKTYGRDIGSLYLRNNTLINCNADENGNGIFTMGYIDSKLNITFNEGKSIHIKDGEAVILNVSVFDDMGNPISGSPVTFTINGKTTINTASDLIEGIGEVRFVPRENGTFIVSGIYGSLYDMLEFHNVINSTIIVENAIADYFGTIYVSQSQGDDDNTGSEDSPVKTFNQGYLLATRANGSFNIIINEGTYYVSGYLLEKSFNVTGIGNPILDGKNSGTLFSLHGEENTEFHFTGLTFINGVANPSRDASMYDGGAIFFKGGILFLENNTFIKNSANDYGGAVYINKGFSLDSGESCSAFAYINNCTFSENYAKYDGGAICLYSADVIVTNSNFNSNSAKYGGAISIASGFGNLTVINCTFNKNNAGDSGGALDIEALFTFNTKYFADIINSTFIENSATIGGAIVGQDTTILNCSFINNSAKSNGGAVVFLDNTSSISKSVFENNSAFNGSAYYGNSTNINNNYWGNKTLSELIKSGIISSESENITSVKLAGEELNTSNLNNSSTIIKVKTTLMVINKSYYVGDTKYLTATLKDLKGNAIKNRKITFNVNGKKYYATTKSNGIATLKITLNSENTYKVTYTFEGDNQYITSTKTSTVKVVKEKTKITAPKKTFKKSLKNKKITITLKSNSGKSLSGKKITLTINGKEYTAKTNSKGQVTLKIKLSLKKTYKYKVSFNGDSKFKSISKTSIIKVK